MHPAEGSRLVVTERLELAAVTVEDLPDFHRLHSDPRTYLHAPESRHPDLAHSASVLEGCIEDWTTRGLGYWSARDRQTGDYLGCGGVRDSGEVWNVYYRFFPSAWGRGLATELVREAGPRAHSIDHNAVLQAVIRPWNQASRRLAERLGMQLTHERVDPAGVTELVYQLPASEFR